jgi:hypothetical protein
VGTQYTNFERFVKAGSSTWDFDGAGNAIDLREVAESTVRADGVLGGGMTVRSGAVLGGIGRIDGPVRIEAGGQSAPGASIGSQVQGNAKLGGILGVHFLNATGFAVGWQASFLQASNVTGACSVYRVSGLGGTEQFNVVPGFDGVNIELRNIQTSAVPEPAVAGPFALGRVGLGLARRARWGR